MGAEDKPELQPNKGASFLVAFDEVLFPAHIVENPGDFGAWTSLIAEIEKTTPDDMGRICQIYDSFLSEFPLCYGYWKKYADHWVRLCDISKAIEVYEQAVQSATYSVHIWVNYCSFGMLSFEDPADVRRLFERGLSLVGKDYLSYLLWDKYIEFEYSQKQWGCLAHIYMRTISFPTKKLHSYYESFKTFAAILEEEIILRNRDAAEVRPETLPVCEVPEAKACEGKGIFRIIQDLLDPGAGPNTLKKFLSTGIHFYQIASDVHAKIEGFESHIRRPYFHVKLLDDAQLENWHLYLDFVELQGDFDWAVKLYERCLIPCANYPEFWIRYVEFVEARGGREIANLALARATQVFLKRVPGIHLFCAKFKEQIGDIFGTRAAFLPCSPELSSDFIENVIRKANMEKRLGNVEAASIIYEEALDMANNAQNQQTLSILFNHFSQFMYMASGNIDAARDVLMRGLHCLPHSKFLLEKLIHFEMMHGGQRKIDVIGSIVAKMTAPPIDASDGLSAKEREEISNLFLEFVDLCGTIHEIRKAWECHRKLFPYQMRPTTCNENASNKISMDKVRVARDGSLGPLPNHASGDDKIPGWEQHPLVHDTSQKNTNLQSDEAVADHSQEEVIGNDSGDGLEQIESAEVVQEHSRSDASEDVGLCDSVHEDITVQLPDVSVEPTSTDQNQIELDRVAEDNLKPPLDFDSLSISHQDDAPPDSTPAKSSDKTPDITSTDGAYSASNAECMQSDMLPHAYTHEQTDSLQRAPAIATAQDVPASTNDEAPDSSPAKSAKATDISSTDGAHSASNAKCMQSDMITDAYVHEQTYSQQSALITAASQHRVKMSGNGNQVSHAGHASREENSHRHTEAKQRQQWQASAQQKHLQAELHSQIVVNQGYTYQQQPWQVPQVQQANQQHPPAAAQVRWTAPNMQQQQAFPSVHQSQQSVPSISHPQAPPYQYPAQFSQQQGTIHNYPGYNPQMWYYYQQQQLQFQTQLQQQQQHFHPQQQHQLQHQLQQQQLQEQLHLRQPQHPQTNPQQWQQQHPQVNPQQWQQQQQKEQEPQPQPQQLPQPQILQHHQQQQQQQQQQINPHIQPWNNYYQQGHIAAGEPNTEQSGQAPSELQEQVHSSQ